MSHLKNTLSGTNTPPENALCVWGIDTWSESPVFMIGYLFHDENAKTWVMEPNLKMRFPLSDFDSFQELTPGGGRLVMVKK